jgi:AbrB family looped-hinge helix DNA binding protein
MKATVSEKGQVTIPKALREQLGIRPGDVLEFSEERGVLVARKVVASNPVDSVYGSLAAYDRFPGMTTDAFMDMIRGPVDLPDQAEAP